MSGWRDCRLAPLGDMPRVERVAKTVADEVDRHHAEERQRALGDDRARDAEGRRDDDRRERVRQDVAEDDPPVARADAPRRLYELALLERQERRAHQA